MKLNLNFYKGLRFKMAFAFSAIFMLISICFSFYTYQYLQKSYVSNFDKYLFSRAGILLSHTEINPDIIALPDTGESVRYFYDDYQQYPHIVFQSPGDISKVHISINSATIDTLNLHGVYLKKNYTNAPRLKILLTVSNKDLQKKLRHLLILIFTSTLTSIIISAIVVYFLSGWLLEPVKQISNKAKQIDTARLNTRLEVMQTHDELQQLTETINSMLSRIEHEQAMQNNFFAAASHELRTPLAVLRAETELNLLKQSKHDDTILLQSQLTEIDRLQHVVQQFLLTSELKNQGLNLLTSEVDLSEQLLKVFVRNQSLIKEKSLQTSILFDIQAESYLIKADSDKLEIVWQNLLLNAIKYSVVKTAIICSVSQANNCTVINIENKIHAKVIATANLGTAFFQSTIDNSGSGLGLWLCHEIIKLHGGDILFESKDHTFFVTVQLPKNV